MPKSNTMVTEIKLFEKGKRPVTHESAGFLTNSRALATRAPEQITSFI